MILISLIRFAVLEHKRLRRPTSCLKEPTPHFMTMRLQANSKWLNHYQIDFFHPKLQHHYAFFDTALRKDKQETFPKYRNKNALSTTEARQSLKSISTGTMEIINCKHQFINLEL